MTDPTRRPKPNSGKAPVPAPRPGQQSARPQPAAARPAQPAPAARPAAQPARAPAPAARARAPEPVDAPAPARRSVVRREAVAGAEPLDETTKKGLIAAGIMVVIAAGVWIVIHNKQQAQADLEAAFIQRIDGFAKDVDDVVKDEGADEAKIMAILARIEAEPQNWKDQTNEGKVQSGKSKLNGRLQDRKVKKEYLEIFNAAVAAIENTGSMSSDDLIKLRGKLSDIQGQAGDMDPSHPEKIKAMLVKIDHILVAKVRKEAKDFSATGSVRQSIAKYATAEDAVRKAIEDANRAKNKADQAEYEEIFKGLLQESDEFSARVINKEFIDSISWTDLLNGPMATKWSTSPVPGFSRRVENGILTISPPEAGSGKEGVAGILDQPTDTLRHFALDMEFSVEGTATLFFHVSPVPNAPNKQQSYFFVLSSKDGGLKAGEKYTMVVSYVGSSIAVEFPGNDGDLKSTNDAVVWTTRRKGGFAFQIPEGTRLKVTRMRIKDLR